MFYDIQIETRLNYHINDERNLIDLCLLVTNHLSVLNDTKGGGLSLRVVIGRTLS